MNNTWKYPPPARGRPRQFWRIVRFTPGLGRKIVERLSQGEAWSRMCLEKEMPSYSTLYLWSARFADFGTAVAQARAMAADAKAERALEVAEATSTSTVQGDRLKVKTLMLHAARMAPKRWSTRAVNPGEDDLAPPPEQPVRLAIRRFKPVVLQDGTKAVVEIFPGDPEYDA
jgi:hypothetical protein